MDTTTHSAWSEGPGLLESVRRYKYVVAFVVLLGGTAAYLYSVQQPPVYEATARLLLTDPRNAQLSDSVVGVVTDPGRYIRNQAEVIRSGAAYPRASELLDGRLTPFELDQQTQVEGFNDVDLIIITASDGTAEGAAEIANAVATAYQEVFAAQVRGIAQAGIDALERRNAAIREELARLDSNPRDLPVSQLEAERTAAIEQVVQNENTIEQLTVDAALLGSGVEVYANAQVPLEPSRPRPLRSAAAGMLLAFVAAAAVAWWRNRTSQRADRGSDVVGVLGAPLLGEIPDYERSGFKGVLPVLESPRSSVAEAYHFVAAALSLQLEDEGGNTIVVTSPTPHDGKTVTALNLALAAAKDRRSVVVVDTDQRALGLTRLATTAFGVEFPARSPAEEGHEWVSAALEVPDAADVRLTLVSVALQLEDPASYFRTQLFRRRIGWVKKRGDLTILDAPPLLAVSETAAIASQVDGVVMVVSRGTSLGVLREVRRRLDFIGTPLVGVVFNRSAGRSSDGYGYGYGYGYGHEEPERGRSVRSPLRRKSRPEPATEERLPERAPDGESLVPSGWPAEDSPDPDPEPRPVRRR